MIDLFGGALKSICARRGLKFLEDVRKFVIDGAYPDQLWFGKFKGRHFRDAMTDDGFRNWLKWLAREPEPESANIGKWYLAQLAVGAENAQAMHVRTAYGKEAPALAASKPLPPKQTEPPKQGPVRGRDLRQTVWVPFEIAARGGTTDVRLTTGETHKLRLLRGTQEGTQITLPRAGHKGEYGGPSGDAVLRIELQPHPIFHKFGTDLKAELRLSHEEALRGAWIKISTFESAVEVSVPSLCKSGSTLRLKGKGYPTFKSAPGDLLLTVKVVYPEHCHTGVRHQSLEQVKAEG